MDAKKRKELPPLDKILHPIEDTPNAYEYFAESIVAILLKEGERKRIMAKIDKAIDDGDVAQFLALVKLLNELNEREIEIQ